MAAVNKQSVSYKKTEEIDAFTKEKLEVAKNIQEYRTIAESYVVGCIYKDPSLLREVNLKEDDFAGNIWRVFFTIAYDLIINEKKNVLDHITFNLYLEKHPKLRNVTDDYGGYDFVESTNRYINVENFEGYVKDLKKFKALSKLGTKGFPVSKKMLSQFNDMSAEDIYNEYTAYLNDSFMDVEGSAKSFNGFDNLHELIDEAEEGTNVGIPLHNAEFLTQEIGGINLNGNIYGLGAPSGCGKSTMAINYLFPSVLDKDEKMVFIINEEDEKKFRKEAIIWVCSNILNHPVKKHELRDGKFSEETRKILHEAADWLEEKKDKKNITIIPLERYSAKIAVKIIKKYSAMGVRLFVLDTLKESYDIGNEATWKGLERDMVALYDTVKPSACNVGLFVTYQLSKSSIKVRHLTNSDIGQGRSIVDTMSCNLLMRRVFDDEHAGGKNALKVLKHNKYGKLEVAVTLHKNKHYMLIFIGKNRFGTTDEYAIVSECDLSTNIYKDIGYCIVPGDYD